MVKEPLLWSSEEGGREGEGGGVGKGVKGEGGGLHAKPKSDTISNNKPLTF